MIGPDDFDPDDTISGLIRALGYLKVDAEALALAVAKMEADPHHVRQLRRRWQQVDATLRNLEADEPEAVTPELAVLALNVGLPGARL